MPRGTRTRGQSDRLRDRQPERKKRGKRGACIDPPGYDAGKKIKGIKRHILVDTVGLLLHAVVHPADIQDRDGGVLLLSTLFGMYPFLAKLWGPLVGPLVAMLSFVCSIGNVPLAAVLWNGGISFGGVIAFIFADLLILPILNIYRKYYGTRMMLMLPGTFYVAMVAAGTSSSWSSARWG